MEAVRIFSSAISRISATWRAANGKLCQHETAFVRIARRKL